MLAGSTGFVAALAALAALCAGLWRFLWTSQHPREPPLIEATIPFITPLFGLLKGNPAYFSALRDRYRNVNNGATFTLRIPFTRFYVVNSPDLVSQIQRKSKVFSFQAITDGFAHKILELSPTARAIQERESQEWIASGRSTATPNHAAFGTLAPGAKLDNMKLSVLQSIEHSAKTWVPAGEKASTVGLYSWVAREITIAITDGVYGAQNPYRDAEVRRAYAVYEAGLPVLAGVPMPWLFARDVLKARDYVCDVFQEFFSRGKHLQAHAFVQERFRWYKELGFPARDLASMEVGNGIAILSNTAPATFWAVYYILSDSEAREACRAEVFAHVITSVDAEGNKTRSLDATALKTACPVFLSAVKEAMRVHSTSLGIRGVLDDDKVGGYLFKKDSTLFMPAAVQHADPRWGPHPQSFDHTRFTKLSGKCNSLFRTFGGGSTLCPGRDFATMSIMMLVAMLLMRFEVRPVGGEWVEPDTKKASMTTVIAPPDDDIKVEIRRYGDDDGVTWHWDLSASRERVIQIVEESSEKDEGRG